MATPITLRNMEEKKKLALQRKQKPNGSLVSFGGVALQPLTTQSGPTTGYQQQAYQVHRPSFTSDSPGGYHYTSFESNVNKHGYLGHNTTRKAWIPAKLPQQIVMKIPEGMPTDEYIIQNDKILCFNGQEHFLSSLYSTPIVLDSIVYKSVECYYQASKIFTLAGNDYALQLHDIDSPLRAKSKAKQILAELHVPKKEINDWRETQGIVKYHQAIAQKFNQNFELRQKLLDTGDAILAQTYEFDSFFDTGTNAEGVVSWAKEKDGQLIRFPSECNIENVPYLPLVGKGKNIIGVLTMKVRKQLKETFGESNNVQEIGDSQFLQDISLLDLGSHCHKDDEVEDGTSGLCVKSSY